MDVIEPGPTAGGRATRRPGAALLLLLVLTFALSGRPAGADEEDAARVAGLIERGASLRAAGSVHVAAQLLDEAAREARRLENAELEGLALHGLIGTLHEAGRLIELRSAIQRFKALADQVGDPVRRRQCEADLGTVNAMLGQHAKALYHLKRALADFVDARDEIGAALTRSTLVGVCRDHGDMVEAIEYGESACRTLAGQEDTSLLAYAEMMLGSVYQNLGDHDRALQLYAQAEDHYAEDDWRSRTDVLGNRAIIAYSRDRLDEAEAALREALDRYHKHGDAFGEVRSLMSLARIAMERGQGEKALELAAKAEERVKPEHDPVLAAETRLLLADAQLAAGLDRTATEAYEGLVREAERQRWTTTGISARRGLATCRLRQRRVVDAIDQARRAAEDLEQRLSGLADEQRITARASGHEIYEIGLEAALTLGDVDEVMDWLERSRTGALLASLGGRQALRAVRLPEDLAEKRTEAQERVVEAQLAYQAALTEGNLKRSQAARDALDAAHDAYEQVVEEIQTHARRFADVSHPVPAAIGEIRASLLRHEAFVAYALTRDRAAALLIASGEAPRLVELGDPAEIGGLCHALMPEADEPTAETATAFLGRLAALERALIEPLALPEATRTLLVSPDACLRRVPFAAVLAAGGRKDLDVALVPSGSTYRLLAEDRALRGQGILAVGDPVYAWADDSAPVRVHNAGAPLHRLPATREEVLAIADGEDDVPLLGEGASEQAFKAALLRRPRWRVVHIACHGRLDLDRWSVCALALTPGGGDDGFLTALEVFGMDVLADLVVLSACTSGGGRIVPGEGTLGLVRAFLAAGTPRVLVSLWRVDDEATRRLMEHFYAALDEGAPPATALRRAQDELRHEEDGPFTAPRYWAAWSLWGLPAR